MANINFNDFISSLFECIKELPGKEAQNKMAPSFRGNFVSNETPRKAGVLILLYPQNNSVYTVLIKRPDYEGIHGGQISLPGGKYEQEDKSIIQTALRETKEEIGIPSNQITIAGSLTPLFVPVSNMSVHPIVGYMQTLPLFIKDEKEVENIIEIPLSEFYNPKNIATKKVTTHQHVLNAPFYNIEENHVWGATAMIISEFVEIARNCPR